MNTVVVVVGILLAIFVLTLLTTYNGLVHSRQEIRVAWARMDEQLKQRYGLVSILVPIAQSIGGNLTATVAPVITAKNQAAIAFDPAQLAVAEAALTSALSTVLTTINVEPSLKADTRLASIQNKLVANQKLIDQTCRRYNEKVDALNSALCSFPHAMTAKAIGLQFMPMFDLRR